MSCNEMALPVFCLHTYMHSVNSHCQSKVTLTLVVTHIQTWVASATMQSIRSLYDLSEHSNDHKPVYEHYLNLVSRLILLG